MRGMINKMQLTTREYVDSVLPKRPDNANKGTMGTLLCICGSYGMAGASYLAASAALRAGAGLVRVAVTEKLYPILAPLLPEAVFTVTEDEKFFTGKSYNALKKASDAASAVLVGCGLGTDGATAQLLCRLLPEISAPLVIDADGLNIISEHIFILDMLKSRDAVITPHPKEMSRLTGASVTDLELDREKTALDFARRYSVSVLYKGHNTVIADKNGRAFVNKTGNSGLATGGSGDVLAGIIASLTAQGIGAFDAAVSAAYIHGRVADILAEKTSKAYLLPHDIVDNLYLFDR